MSADASVRKSRKTPAAARGPSGGDQQSSLRPWHLFFVATLAAASAGAVAVGGTSPANVVFVALAIVSAGTAAFALYGTIWPLVGPDAVPAPDMLGGRTRAALEREKALVLRAIKELEFDRAMRKVSEADFQDMGGRLRARAIGLIKQLDTGSAGYRELIEREISARQQAVARNQPATVAKPAPPSAVAPAAHTPFACGQCGTLNDSDAQFCKQCGNKFLVFS